MDFSDCPEINQYYGGSERKIGIICKGSGYMLKFQKKTAFGTRMNHVSEYLGSHIFNLLNIPAQETFLGKYKGEEVVACRDFIPRDGEFVPFNDVGESTLDHDKDQYQYDYTDVMRLLQDNSKLTHVQETISAFWRIYIVDAFLGNFDRHGSNWGFIKKNNKYTLAPVFDNGSCLFPQMVDDSVMLQTMQRDEEFNRRVFTFPTSQIQLHGQKSSYYEVIHSLAFPECNDALVEIVKRINMRMIHDLVNQTAFTSGVRKRFLICMLQIRFDKILLASYQKLTGEKP